MSRCWILALGVFGLSACTPPPRSAAYLEAHPFDLRMVQASCTRGWTRGAACDNAQTAHAHRDADARMRLYKSAFEGR